MASGESLVEFYLNDEWVDVTADVRSFETDRRSERRRGIAREWSPGTARITLNNGETRYDTIAMPELRPGTPVRISADGGAGMVRVFTGTLEDGLPDYSEAPAWEYITFTAIDAGAGFARADLAELVAPVGGGDTVSERLERILDAVGWPSELRDISSGGVELAETTYGGNAWRLMERAAAADPGQLWINTLGEPAFRSLADTLTAVVTPAATFGTSVGGLRINALQPRNDRELLVNEYRYSLEGGEINVVRAEASKDLYTEGIYWTLEDLELPHQHQEDADDLAALTLLASATPEVWFESMSLVLTGSEPMQQAVLGLDVASIIRVVYPPVAGGDPIDRTALVRGVRHSKANGRRWRCTLTLESASRYNFLRFDDPATPLDRAGFAPGLSQTFTGGRWEVPESSLAVVDDMQVALDQMIYGFEGLADLGDADTGFVDPVKGQLVQVGGELRFHNGVTWVRPRGVM